MEDNTLSVLLDIKDDMASTRESVGRIEGRLLSLPCGMHLQEIRDLRSEVAGIKEKDLPEIRQHFAVLDWFRKGRNKALVAILAGILGLAGSLLGTYLTKKLMPDASAAAVSTPSYLRPVITPAFIPPAVPTISMPDVISPVSPLAGQ